MKIASSRKSATPTRFYILCSRKTEFSKNCLLYSYKCNKPKCKQQEKSDVNSTCDVIRSRTRNLTAILAIGSISSMMSYIYTIVCACSSFINSRFREPQNFAELFTFVCCFCKLQNYIYKNYNHDFYVNNANANLFERIFFLGIYL